MNSIDQESIKSFWDKRAELYGRVPLSAITNFADDTESKSRDALEKRAVYPFLRNKGRVLDLGCGVGRLSLWMSEFVDHVTGIDFSYRLLDVARYEASLKNNTNVEFIYAASDEYRKRRSFDAVTVFGLFIYLNDDPFFRTVSNIAESVKKEGTIVVKESVGVCRRFQFFDKFCPALDSKYSGIYRTPSDIIRAFEVQDCQLVECRKLYQHQVETGVWLFVFKEGCR